MSERVRHVLKRVAASIVLPLSVIPMLLVVPTLVSAYENFDRRHRSQPLPPPAGTHSAADLARWTPLPPNRLTGVPVLLYHGINENDDHLSVAQRNFARQMAMLRHAGFRSISIRKYVEFLRGNSPSLPERPILITFDDGRLDSYRGADRVLQKYGMRATMFAITGAVDGKDVDHTTWKELQQMQSSGRWDIQPHGSEGHTEVTHRKGKTGAAYAYRRFTRSSGQETITEWEQRVTGDIFQSREDLLEHLKGVQPLTFAVPYGNYGQVESNDPRISQILGGFLHRQFEATFVQNPLNDPSFTTPRSHHGDAQRYVVHTTTTADDVYAWLKRHSTRTVVPMRAPQVTS